MKKLNMRKRSPHYSVVAGQQSSSSQEVKRLAALSSYNIMDTLPERSFDDITRLAAFICGTKISLVSLVDRKRQWFKSNFGLDAKETPREWAFCSHAINEPDEVLEVGDSRKDDRFKDNPLVVGEPHVIFYAGAPLITTNGYALGTLCVIDDQPNRLSEEQRVMLQSLSRLVVDQLEYHKFKDAYLI
jgi:GAF domain-containing protein